MLAYFRLVLISLCFLGFWHIGFSQKDFLSLPDTSLFVRDTLRPLVQKFGNVQISGYLQPQWQWASEKGAKSFAGGDFSSFSNNRFTLRRGRLRIDYSKLNTKGQPTVYFVFQFDGTERGLFIRDFFGKIYEQKLGFISFTTGMFARPISFEVNYASAFRESPERARVTQTLLPTERDLGAMITLQPKRLSSILNRISLDFGVFNGQGLTNNLEFDSHKDIIGRLSLVRSKQFKIWDVAASVAYLNGGTYQAGSSHFFYQKASVGLATFVQDSNPSNVGKIAPREYFEADLQFRIKSRWGTTEIRAEYWQGTQSGLRGSNRSPANKDEIALPAFNRKFNAGIFYLIQPLFTPKVQLVLKYDWFDPNTQVSGNDIGVPGSNISETDIKYQTYGFGLNYFLNQNLKFIAYYDLVRNEHTRLNNSFAKDVKDDVFTFRIQFMF